MARMRILGMRPLMALAVGAVVFLFWGKIKPAIVNIVAKLKGSTTPASTPSLTENK